MYKVNLVWVWRGWEVLIISYSMSPGRNLLKIPRLHFPVSGISISWSPFFIPARIPQDSSGSGFLFFPEEFFYRNLLLAGLRNPELLRNLRNTPEFPFPPKHNYSDWERPCRWRGVGPYHGLWWTYASTQYIAVTLTSRATRRYAGSRAYVHHSLSDFAILGVRFSMHELIG